MTFLNFIRKIWYKDRLLRVKRLQKYEEVKGNETFELEKIIRDTEKKLEKLK